MRHAETVAEQLQYALNSRVIIEQANGVLSQHGDISPEEAFRVLRDHSRNTNVRLTEVCRAVVDRTTDPASLIGVGPADAAPTSPQG